MKIICDWENCNEIGAYKAPIEKDNSKKYRLLCLEHIKIFNKNWNYFENMIFNIWIFPNGHKTMISRVLAIFQSISMRNLLILNVRGKSRTSCLLLT